jgi:hypothetical protein
MRYTNDEGGECVTGVTYATSDFYLAAYLKAQGMMLEDTQREGRRTIFVFADRGDRPSLVRGFYNDGAVRVNAFTHAIQDLKAVVYNW